MDELSPQGALLMLCICRLPERTLPRHAWAAEVLVEQLWAATDHIDAGGWREVLAPLIKGRSVDARRVRAEVWDLAQAGALVPVGVGAAAMFEASEGPCRAVDFGTLTPQQDRAVAEAVGQLTATLLAFSKTLCA